MSASTTSTTKRLGTSTSDIALIAVFAALIAVCSVSAALPIGINGVPITLQVFAVFLTGAVLGAWRGFLSVLLYLVVGAAGLPIFAGGAAGLAPFAGGTGGYLVAFPFAAAIVGFTVERLHRRQLAITAGAVVVAGVIAELLVYAGGAAGFVAFLDMGWRAAFTAAAAYIPGDLVKLVVAAIVAAAVHRAFPTLLGVRR